MKETDKQNQHQGNYTYIVKCSDETLYTGWTNNLKKRLEAHNSGKGAKYTKNRRPVELVYSEGRSKRLPPFYIVKEWLRMTVSAHAKG